MRIIIVCVALLCMVASVESRDTVLKMSISKSLRHGRASGAIGRDVRLQFGARRVRGGQRRYTANRKTNSFNKTDREACEWVFFSAVRALQDRARKKGVHRVTGIISYYKKRAYSSSSVYECHVGNIVAGVTLRGNI